MNEKFKQFLTEKGISEADYKEKDSAEMANLFNEFQEKNLKDIEAAVKEKKDGKEVNALIQEALKNTATTEETTKMQKSIDDLLEEFKQLKEDPSKDGKAVSFDSAIKDALEKANPKLKEMRASTGTEGKELVMTIKVADNIMTTDVANADGVVTPAAAIYQGINSYATDVRPDQYIIEFMDNGRTDKAALPYMDKLPTEGNMAVTEEGELKPLISISFELRYSQADKIAGRVKVSEEALDDINGLMTIIRNELLYEHSMAQQSWIFTKINAVAGAFVAGGMAGSTDAPSNYDAIRAAIYAVKIQSDGKYIPNAVLVPSADVYNMGATKDLNNQYVFPPFVMPDGTKVSGVQVIEVNDSSVAEGSFIVGDFRKLKRRVYKDFTIRIGQGIQGSATAADIVSDFESNMYTIIGESRQHLFIYENEKAAFVKATFASVKTAIETPAG